MSKSAIVTGGTKGIGAALARRLASFGYDLSLVYFGPESEGERAEQMLSELKKQFEIESIVLLADVSKYEQCGTVVDKTVARFGGVDVLVNNAGIVNSKPFLDLKPQEYERLFGVDILAHFHMCKHVLPHMVAAEHGNIINISSICGWKPVPWQADYCAAKAAVMGMTRALAAEFGEKNIRINSIAPGMHWTDMLRSDPPEVIEGELKNIPLGRIGEAEDVADALEFILKSNYVTGQVISPNGGLWMH